MLRWKSILVFLSVIFALPMLPMGFDMRDIQFVCSKLGKKDFPLLGQFFNLRNLYLANSSLSCFDEETGWCSEEPHCFRDPLPGKIDELNSIKIDFTGEEFKKLFLRSGEEYEFWEVSDEELYSQDQDHPWKPFDTIMVLLISCVIVAIIWICIKLIYIGAPLYLWQSLVAVMSRNGTKKNTAYSSLPVTSESEQETSL